jgi:hypothetical protein
MADSCEHGHEHVGSIKYTDYFDHLSDYHLPLK